MEKQCVDALAKLNAVIMILEEGGWGGWGGCSGDMANKDAFCQPPVSSAQTSAFLKHLLLLLLINSCIIKIFTVCFSTICEHVFIYIIRWSAISGETISSQGLQEKINKRVFPFYSPNCWTNTLKA